MSTTGVTAPDPRSTGAGPDRRTGQHGSPAPLLVLLLLDALLTAARGGIPEPRRDDQPARAF